MVPTGLKPQGLESRVQKQQESRSGRVAAQQEGGLLWITFDNEARMNALDKAMWSALPGLIAEAEQSDGVRVVILRGAGTRAFSAGADISEFDQERTGASAKAYDALNQAAFEAVRHCGKPTIATISGFCLGGGLELALCCDMRLAAEGSEFAIPAARLGIGYNPRWFAPLLAAVSPAFAKEMLFTGKRYSAKEAQTSGLVNRVVGQRSLETETRALADAIAENAPLAIHAAKRTVDAHLRTPGEAELAALDALVEACFESADYAEGRAAFREKRKPKFTGK
jgi:enoyl-CoA hydratase/carnithine racemase